MKPLSFNLKDAKKVSGDKTSSTFQVKGGHQIRVAHAALKPEHKAMIEKLPIHAATGYVPPSISSADIEGSDMSAESAPAPETPASSPPPQAQPQPATQPQGEPEAVGAEFKKGYSQAQRGIRENQAVNSEQSQANQKLLADSSENQFDILNNINEHRREFAAQHKAFLDDAAAGHIDPNHYLQNQSAGSKVATAIGLFLGGLSTPYTHQANPALQFLNAQIDRDIVAQKENLNQTNTLYQANRQYFGDNLMAENATRAQLLGITQTKLQEEAEKLGTPRAKAAADAATAQLKMSQGQLIDQNAVRKSALEAVNHPGQVTTDPSQLVPILVPKEHQAQVYKELAARQNIAQNGEEFLRQWDIANTHNQLTGKGAAAINNLNALALPLIHDAEGRVNEFEQKTIQDLYPSKYIQGKENAAAKRQGVVDFLNQKKSAPTAKAYLGDLDRYVSTHSAQQQPVEKQTPDGRIGLFDPTTKQFLRYK